MEKKFLMPSMDELYEMQEYGANIYKYLLCKAVEAIVIEGKKYPNREILKTAYKYIRENPYLATAICRMYPKEIQYSGIAQSDPSLCLYHLRKKADDSIYNLDNLAYFDKSLFDNLPIILETISLLDTKLPERSEYRFEYKENPLLDNIFGGKFDWNKFIIPDIYKEQIYTSLTRIEPYYALLEKKSGVCGRNIGDDLNRGINAYSDRYGIGDSVGAEFTGRDILTKPNNDVKKLIRCINNNKDNMY